MKRYKFGPAIGDHTAKGDAPVAYKGHSKADDTHHFHFSVPPHDASCANRLARIHVIMAPKGSGPAEGETPEDFLAKGHPGGNVEVGDVAAGAEIAVPVPNLPPANYEGQTVLEYEDDEPTPADPATTDPADPTAAAPADTPSAPAAS